MGLVQEWNTTQFDSTLNAVTQQNGSLLASTVYMGGDFEGGESVWTPWIGAKSFTEISNRLGDTQFTEPDAFQRRIDKRKFELAELFDQFEDFDRICDPKGKYMPEMAKARGRQMDDVIIQAATATVYQGNHNSSSGVVLPASQKITESGTDGLTLDKIKEVNKKFQKKELADAQKYWLLDPSQVEDLLNINQFTSMDYNLRAPLMEGKPVPFMGFIFIMTNRLPIASSKRTNIIYTERAIEVRMDMYNNTTADRLPTKRNAVGMQTHLYFGASRQEEVRVVTCECHEA